MKNKKEMIAKKIKEFGYTKYGKLVELAKHMGISPQALQTYTEGKSIPGGGILYKLRELGCDINWLLAGESEYSKLTFYKVSDLGVIPEFKFDITELVPKNSKELIVHEEWYHKEVIKFDPQTHIFLKINEENGISMTPLLLPGDLVLLDTKKEAEENDLVAAKWDGNSGEVRIISEYEGDSSKVVLWSFNNITKPIIKSKNELIIYKVVMIKKHS